MDQRDKELDDMLAPLRRSVPTALESRRWQTAVDRLVARQDTRRLLLPLLAASLVGAVLGLSGLLAFQHAQPQDRCKQEVAAEKFDVDATTERTFVKLD